MQIILASASPRRAELLRAAGCDFDIAAPHVDESIRDGESPDRYVRRLAADKSAAAMARLPGRDCVVIGADTTVVIAGETLGKPLDDREASAMLRRLSGRRHTVLTGVSLRRGTHELGRVEATAVEFLALSEDDIAWYVASGEWRDKAGAYAIQGLASRFIPRIDGSYSNVVGLPIACVFELLAGISRLKPAG